MPTWMRASRRRRISRAIAPALRSSAPGAGQRALAARLKSCDSAAAQGFDRRRLGRLGRKGRLAERRSWRWIGRFLMPQPIRREERINHAKHREHDDRAGRPAAVAAACSSGFNATLVHGDGPPAFNFDEAGGGRLLLCHIPAG